jgi:WD40 repeat protein
MAWMVEPENPDNHGTFGGTPDDAPRAPAGVAFSADGKFLASIQPKHTELTSPSGLKPDTHWPVRIWSTDGKGLVRSLQGHANPVTSVAWSKDGTVIATGDEKGTVILWDAATGKELWQRKLVGRDDTAGRINAVALSPTDNTVAVAVSMGSGKGSERVALFAAKDGRDYYHLTGPSALPVSSVAWGLDGTFLVTGCGTAGKPIAETEPGKPAVGYVIVWERK